MQQMLSTASTERFYFQDSMSFCIDLCSKLLRCSSKFIYSRKERTIPKKGQEGTTQGNPLEMTIYSISNTPLLNLLIHLFDRRSATVAFADKVT